MYGGQFGQYGYGGNYGTSYDAGWLVYGMSPGYF